MAITVLGSDFSALGTWQLDYDDVTKTVGHTCQSTGGTSLVITVTEVDTTTGQPTGVSFHKDISADSGQGRVVDLSNVPNSRVPVHVKGQIYPYDFDGSWQP
jgi:hypothetical protein